MKSVMLCKKRARDRQRRSWHNIGKRLKILPLNYEPMDGSQEKKRIGSYAKPSVRSVVIGVETLEDL